MPAKLAITEGFTLTVKERTSLECFLEEHGNYCQDSGLTFERSHNSGIGWATKVTCQCGVDWDITDYGAW